MEKRVRARDKSFRSPKDKYNLLCCGCSAVPHRKRNFIINTRHYHIHFSAVGAAAAVAEALAPAVSVEAVRDLREVMRCVNF